METLPIGTVFGARFGQVAWVVKDILAAENFFRDVIGISNFVKMENLRAQDLTGTHYGKPGNYIFHLYLAYSGESMIELIQPVSGESIFQDYLDQHPAGGVHHIAYTVPESDLDKAVSEFKARGYPVISSLTLPVASVAFFDTSKDIGVITEVIGLTETGVGFVRQLKAGTDN